MIGRRAFLRHAIIWVPAAAAALDALFSACSDDSSSGTEESTLSNCTEDGTCDTTGEINYAVSANHGHQSDLTQAGVNSGQAQTVALSAASTDGHTHTVALTAEMIADIAAGKSLHVESSIVSAHSHCVSFNCSSGGGGGGYLQSRERS